MADCVEQLHSWPQRKAAALVLLLEPRWSQARLLERCCSPVQSTYMPSLWLCCHHLLDAMAAASTARSAATSLARSSDSEAGVIPMCDLAR